MANDIDKNSPHYKGEFGSIYEVNQKFPSGGVAGDYVAIDGWAHYWNADRGTWCVNAKRDSYWDELITNIVNHFKTIKGATYMGVAGIDTVPEKESGAKMYYFATQAGTYNGFGGLNVPQGIAVLFSEDGKSWVCQSLLEVAQETGDSELKVLSQKAVKEALSQKVDSSTMTTELGKKADKSYVDTELGKKADSETVDAALAEKADSATVDAALAKKADSATVDAALAKKADSETVDAALAKKADSATVDAALAKKADSETVDAALAKKADSATVDAANAKQDAIIGGKANQVDVERSLKEIRDSIGDRVVVSGNVSNNPDEEDLTSKTSPYGTEVLSLKDREHNPLEFSGKGYKILRKNIQNVTCAITKIEVTKVPSADGYVSIIINGVETHVDLVAATDNTVAAVAKKIADKLGETLEEYVTSVDGALVTCTRRFGGDVTSSSSFSGVNTGAEATVSETSKTEPRNLITDLMVNQPNTIYEIRYDFDLDGKTLEMPENCVLKFNGGSLRNGKLILNNTYIDNAYDSFCLRLAGTVKNTKISSLWVSSLSYFELDFSNKIISVDRSETIKKPLILKDAKCCKVIGNYNKICNLGCAAIQPSGDFSNIEVSGFISDGQNTSGSYFFGNDSSVGYKENVSVHDNYIFNQSMGISFNADLAGYYRFSKIYNNVLENIIGTESGSGYGIHLANAQYCDIFNNIIIGAQRHSIYHAWGNHNKIYSNRIIEHRKNVPFNVRAALAIFRSSYCLEIYDNVFENNYAVDIHLEVSGKSKDDRLERYTDMHDINIHNNNFIHNNIENKTDHYCIMIGYNVFSSYFDIEHKIYNVFITNNTFILDGLTVKGCTIFHCEHTTIDNNLYYLGDTAYALFLDSRYKKDYTGITSFTNNNIIPTKNRNKDVIYVPDTFDYYETQTFAISNNNLVDNRKSKDCCYCLYPSFFESLYNGVQSRNITIVGSKPSSGYYLLGDIVYTYMFNEQLAYKCLESGSPGVWSEICPGLMNTLYNENNTFSDINNIKNGVMFTCGRTVGIKTIEGIINANGENVYFNKIGLLENAPKKADMDKPLTNGSQYFCTNLNRMIYQQDGHWFEGDGCIAGIKREGTSSERPTCRLGFQFFDTTLNKPIWWTGSKWVDATGADAVSQAEPQTDSPS